jgi:hypothetical protein
LRLLVAATFCCLLVAAGLPAATRTIEDITTTNTPPAGHRALLLWNEDNESGGVGWTHGDNTATATPHFHVDTYHAWEGGTYSYWCGRLDPAFTGGDGYGNGWDERLLLPSIDLTTPPSTYPVLTYRFRHDSEPTYDFTYVQAESLGGFVNLNRGYDGSSGGWQDIGVYGFVLIGYDDPVSIRFRFISDAAYSDEDAVYDSDAGAFHVDDLKIFDYFSGHVYFFDDVEDGVGQCTPTVPDAAGDYWHIVEKPCSANTDPHCWWCGDDADTTLIPPGLDNWLMTPMVDLSGAVATTLRFILHAEVPTVDDDYWTEEVTMNGGGSWYHSGTYWGDYGSCAGWSLRAILFGINLVPFVTDNNVFAFRLTMHTTDNGCGPGAGGGAGLVLDDVYLEGYVTPVEMNTWGSIKAMYRQ